jgi:hypothetical protein
MNHCIIVSQGLFFLGEGLESKVKSARARGEILPSLTLERKLSRTYHYEGC